MPSSAMPSCRPTPAGGRPSTMMKPACIPPPGRVQAGSMLGEGVPPDLDPGRQHRDERPVSRGPEYGPSLPTGGLLHSSEPRPGSANPYWTSSPRHDASPVRSGPPPLHPANLGPDPATVAEQPEPLGHKLEARWSRHEDRSPCTTFRSAWRKTRVWKSRRVFPGASSRPFHVWLSRIANLMVSEHTITLLQQGRSLYNVRAMEYNG